MAVATTRGGWVYPCISKPNRYYWNVSYVAPAFNDTNIQCTLPATLNMGGYLRILYVDQMTVLIDGAAAGVVIGSPMLITPISGEGIFLEPWTTTVAYDMHQWSVGFATDASAFVTTRMPYLGTLSGYAAADTAYITLHGWLEVSANAPLLPEVKPPEPTPVLLEGFKWPLTRRT